MTPRTNCLAHCAECGSHFAGDTAFFRHRAGPNDNRYCLDPYEVTDKGGERVFYAKSERASCGLMGAEPRVGVVLWSLRESLGVQGRLGRAA